MYLNDGRKNYAQIDKEGLAVVYGVKKFHQMLYGQHFTIVTDHKPLLGLFGETKIIPLLESGRIQKWALTLSAYEYTLWYRKGCDMSNDDALNMIPLKKTISTFVPIPGELLRLVNWLESSPMDAGKIRNWTRFDPVLSKVLTLVSSGWPDRGVGEESMQPYFRCKDEITVHDGFLLWGQSVILPELGRQRILEELHGVHPGVCRMKALA